MRRLTIFAILSSFTLFFVASGCSHITHRARVNEGFNMSASITPNYETYDPPRTRYLDQNRPDDLTRYARTDLQVFLGYGWLAKNDGRFLLQLNMASAIMESSEVLPIFSTGIYYQGTPSDLPYALGFGFIVGPDPLFYALWGRDFGGVRQEDKKYGIDIGGGFGLIPSVLVHAKLTRKLGDVRLGLVSEYRRFWGALDTHYETPDFDDYILSQFFFGIVLYPEFR